jgi:hypothetical protein
MIAYSIYRQIKKTKAKNQQRKHSLQSGDESDADLDRKQRRSSFPTHGFLLFEDMDDDTKYPSQVKSQTLSRDESIEYTYTLEDML